MDLAVHRPVTLRQQTQPPPGQGCAGHKLTFARKGLSLGMQRWPPTGCHRPVASCQRGGAIGCGCESNSHECGDPVAREGAAQTTAAEPNKVNLALLAHLPYNAPRTQTPLLRASKIKSAPHVEHERPRASWSAGRQRSRVAPRRTGLGQGRSRRRWCDGRIPPEREPYAGSDDGRQ